MTTGMIILIIYIIAVLGIAIYVSRHDEKNIQEFITTESGLGIFVLTLTLSATYHSSYAFLGAPGFAYEHGVGWWANGIWTVFPGVLFWYIGRRVWYMGRKYNYNSLAKMVGSIYQSKLLGVLITFITMIFTIPYVAMQAIGSGYIFETLSQGAISYEIGAISFLVIMILIVFIGGMKGVAFTDAAQGVFMWIGLVAGSYIVIKRNFPSVAEAYTQAAGVVPELFTMPGPNGLVTMQDWISRWSVITIGMMMFPHITLRFFSSRNLEVLKWSSVFSSIYLTSIYVLIPAVGITGNLLMPNIGAADTIFPELLLRFTNVVFASLVISGALAASMSTGDSQLHAVGSMITTDIYKPYINKGASDEKQYNVAKLWVLIVGVLSIIFALMRPGMLGDILALANGGVAVLSPAVLGGLFWKKSHKMAAFASIIIGEIVLVILTFFVAPPFGFMSAFWAMMVALVIFVGMSIVQGTNYAIVGDLEEMKDYFA